jgi:hypothetical protein
VPDTVILLEHPPVVTLGRRTDESAELHIPEDADVELYRKASTRILSTRIQERSRASDSVALLRLFLRAPDLSPNGERISSYRDGASSKNCRMVVTSSRGRPKCTMWPAPASSTNW